MKIKALEMITSKQITKICESSSDIINYSVAITYTDTKSKDQTNKYSTSGTIQEIKTKLTGKVDELDKKVTDYQGQVAYLKFAYYKKYTEAVKSLSRLISERDAWKKALKDFCGKYGV